MIEYIMNPSATLSHGGLDYSLVNIWSLLDDFHRVLQQNKFYRNAKIEAPFYMASWVHSTHPKRGSESTRILSTVSELGKQKV